jgi:hypothetical protein
MKSIGANIIGINEPNLNLRHPYIRRLFYQHQRQVWEHSKFTYASSNIDTGIRKPGGTILGITGKLTSRVTETSTDPMGRWTSITLLGRLRAKLRASQREVRELSRKAFDLRNQQKEELANAIATVEGMSKEKALQRVQRAQHTKEMFARLPSIKPKTSSGISMIKVPVDKPDKPKEALVWKTINDATDVETAILNQQKLHFSQAKDTPFAKEALKNIFNWSGTSHHAERVLSQQFTPPPRHHVSSRLTPPTLLPKTS